MITSYIAKTADVFFSPLLTLPPLFSLLTLSFIFSLLVLLYQRRIFSNKNVREMKRKLDEIREKIIKLQDRNKEELNEFLNEMLKLNARLMKENLKVSLLSLCLGILILSWVSFHYSGYYVKLPLPYLSKLNLVYFYVILCLVIGVVLGKFLEVR